MSERNTLIQMVLDKSGSMDIVRDATISGVNEFLGEHRTKVPTARFSLTLFDTKFDLRHVNVRMIEVPDLTLETYSPGGNTALLDAVGATIRAIESLGDIYERVVFVIVTDGQENSSKEFTRQQVKDLIDWHTNEDKGWEFTFIGANIDSYTEAGLIGVPMANVMNYNQTQAGTQAAFHTVSRSSTAYATGQAPDMAYSAKDRKKVESTK